MASITFAISPEVKAEMKRLSWVNWSEVAREELTADLRRTESLEKFMKIVSKSKLSKKDAALLSDKVKLALHKRLKKEGLI